MSILKINSLNGWPRVPRRTRRMMSRALIRPLRSRRFSSTAFPKTSLNELGREVVKARDASLDPYATRAVPASQIKLERNGGGGSAMDSQAPQAACPRHEVRFSAQGGPRSRRHGQVARAQASHGQARLPARWRCGSGLSCPPLTATVPETTPESARRTGALPMRACSNATPIWLGSASRNSA